MTAKHNLTKRYHKRQDITIDAISYSQFFQEKRDTLDHIVQYHHREYLVTSKPPYKGYKHYKVGYY